MTTEDFRITNLSIWILNPSNAFWSDILLYDFTNLLESKILFSYPVSAFLNFGGVWFVKS